MNPIDQEAEANAMPAHEGASLSQMRELGAEELRAVSGGSNAEPAITPSLLAFPFIQEA